VSRMGDELKLHSDFVGKPEGKRPHKRKRLIWNQNGSLEDWLRGVECIQLSQDRGQWRSILNMMMT
jgi:hypothetical protein